MKKETFVQAINTIEKQMKLDVEISESLGRAFPNAHTANLLPENHIIIEAFMDLLRDEMDDKDDWIGWFCYEIDFGERSDNLGAFDMDGNKIKIENAEDLYDMIG